MENKQIKEIYKNHNEQEEIQIFDIKYGDNIKIFVFYQLDVIINLMGINQYNII